MINSEFKILIDNLDKKKADELLLVLTAKNIIAVKDYYPSACVILVEKKDYHAALKQIRLYSKENRMKTSGDVVNLPVKWYHFTGGVWVSVLLFIIHYQTTSGLSHSDIVNRFGASAYAITHGKFYLSFTALLLHSGWVHLIGNMAGIIIFGGFVCVAVSGKQLSAWLMIILSGISGNIFNAFFHKSFHLSIGASTSVFGAIGILAGINYINYLEKELPPVKAMKPVAAGLALIAFMGSGENADLSGHVFGFFSGTIIGMTYSLIQLGSLIKLRPFITFGSINKFKDKKNKRGQKK